MSPDIKLRTGHAVAVFTTWHPCGENTRHKQHKRGGLSFRFQVSQTRGLTGSAGPDETVSGVKRYRGAGWLTPRQIERRQRERQTDRQTERDQRDRDTMGIGDKIGYSPVISFLLSGPTS